MLRKNQKIALQMKIRNIIFDYIYETFGRSEAVNPSWYIPTLAEEIASKLLDENYRPQHPYHNEEDAMEAEDNQD